MVTAGPPREMVTDRERSLLAAYGLEPEVRLVLAEPNVRVRILTVGEGPAVMLLHGGGGTAALWAPLMAELPNVTLHAVDRPGCGVGDAFDYRGVDLRRHAVAFVESVLDALGLDRPPFVANSLGGLWTFWFAIDRPDRVSAMVQLGCPALLFGTRGPPLRGFRSVRTPARSLARSEQAIRMFEREASPAAVRRMGPEMLVAMYEAEIRPAHLATRQSMLEEIFELRDRQPDLGVGEEELRRIVQPAVLVWGDRDSFGPPEVGRSVCERLPNGSLEVLPGVGHFPWIEEPAVCARAVLAVVRSLASA